MIRHLQFRRRDVANRLQQPAMIEPVDPLQSRILDRIEVPPRTATVNDFGLVEADDGLGQRVVVRVADTADRRFVDVRPKLTHWGCCAPPGSGLVSCSGRILRAGVHASRVFSPHGANRHGPTVLMLAWRRARGRPAFLCVRRGCRDIAR